MSGPENLDAKHKFRTQLKGFTDRLLSEPLLGLGGLRDGFFDLAFGGADASY